MNNLKNKSVFISDLVSSFPEIRDEVLDEDYDGLITLQIGCFKRFTQRAIDNNDLILVKKCFDFVEANLNTVEKEVENSLFISYLGKLGIPKNSKIEKLLPEAFKNSIKTLDEYNNSKSNNKKYNSFMKDLTNNKYKP